jgi:hypothetical protein
VSFPVNPPPDFVQHLCGQCDLIDDRLQHRVQRWIGPRIGPRCRRASAEPNRAAPWLGMAGRRCRMARAGRAARFSRYFAAVYVGSREWPFARRVTPWRRWQGRLLTLAASNLPLHLEACFAHVHARKGLRTRLVRTHARSCQALRALRCRTQKGSSKSRHSPSTSGPLEPRPCGQGRPADYIAAAGARHAGQHQLR